MMILTKLSRTKGKFNEDNWIDIAGYAGTVEMLLDDNIAKDGEMFLATENSVFEHVCYEHSFTASPDADPALKLCDACDVLDCQLPIPTGPCPKFALSNGRHI